MYNFAIESYNMSKRREKNKPHNELNKQLDYEVKEKEKDDNKIQLGKFFYSLSGVTYAGAVLGVGMNFELEKVVTLASGVLLTIILAVTGWTIVKRGNIKK